MYDQFTGNLRRLYNKIESNSPLADADKQLLQKALKALDQIAAIKPKLIRWWNVEEFKSETTATLDARLVLGILKDNIG